MWEKPWGRVLLLHAKKSVAERQARRRQSDDDVADRGDLNRTWTLDFNIQGLRAFGINPKN